MYLSLLTRPFLYEGKMLVGATDSSSLHLSVWVTQAGLNLHLLIDT